MKPIELSIIIPAFNEEKSLPQLLEKLINLEYQESTTWEIIIVDDASTDSTAKIARKYLKSNIRFHQLEFNSGKGAAVQAGMRLAVGSHYIIQDADLEYFPNDIPFLYLCAKKNPGATIYGSRVLGAKQLQGFRGMILLWPKQALSSWLFNFFLTLWLFCIQKVWITDTLTGYKLYPSDIFASWFPKTLGFETDHEITSHILNENRNILEVPIKYEPRSKIEGKKIRAIDGYKALRAFWVFRK